LAVNLSGRSKTGVDHDRPTIGLNSAEFWPAVPPDGVRSALEL
jgi:hypothetical protein